MVERSTTSRATSWGRGARPSEGLAGRPRRPSPPPRQPPARPHRASPRSLVPAGAGAGVAGTSRGRGPRAHTGTKPPGRAGNGRAGRKRGRRPPARTATQTSRTSPPAVLLLRAGWGWGGRERGGNADTSPGRERELPAAHGPRAVPRLAPRRRTHTWGEPRLQGPLLPAPIHPTEHRAHGSRPRSEPEWADRTARSEEGPPERAGEEETPVPWATTLPAGKKNTEEHRRAGPAPRPPSLSECSLGGGWGGGWAGKPHLHGPGIIGLGTKGHGQASMSTTAALAANTPEPSHP